jgi:signal transduction histidine kinase
MTLGLPEHLARESLSRALSRAGHWAAAVCLGSALLVTIASAIAASTPMGDGPERQRAALAATALLAIQALLLVLAARFDTVTLTVVSLIAGTAAVFGLTALILDSGEIDNAADTAPVALSRAALVLVGGAGIGSRIAITWAVLGWGLGEAAAFLGAVTAGAAWAPSLSAIATLAIVVLSRAFDAASRRVVDRRETALHRASQQTRELTIRHDYELRAIARLHDTALSHLVAIATAGSGPVDDRLRTAIRNDLTLIVGRDWAADHAAEPADAATAGAADGRLATSGAVPSRAGRRAGWRAADQPSATSGTRPGAPADAAHTAGLAAGPDGRAAGTGTSTSASISTTAPPLSEALGIARDAGITVRVGGSPDALELLGPRRRDALEAAVGQCLVNVIRHAGVDEAEVAVGPGDGEVTVVVVDSGAGFDVDEVPDDRIGLRTSIKGRIEQEGGSVRIWSRPGVGTTVVLSVPEGGA